MSDWRKFNARQLVMLIHSGNYKGRHYIYKDVAAFDFTYPHLEAVPWWKAETGGWAITDDGFVMQCLKRRMMVNGRNLRPTVAIRTVLGTFPHYVRKDGTTSSRFVAGEMLARRKIAFGSHGRSSMAATSTPYEGKYWNKKKEKFARLYLMGMQPRYAYALIYGELNMQRAHNRAERIIRRHKDRVMDEIKNVYKDAFKALGWDETRVAEELIRLASGAKSELVRLQAIDKITDMRGEKMPSIQIGPVSIAPPIPIAPPQNARMMAPLLPPRVEEIEEEPEMEEANVVDSNTLPSST